MKTNPRICQTLFATCIVITTLSAEARLIDRGNGMIFDSTQNITWLQDWNYAATSGYKTGGVMDWNAAKAWANGLVFGGYDDWRLPASLNPDGSGPCVGYTCVASEFGHMFFTEFAATAGNTVLSGTNTVNLALFRNLKTNNYWTGTQWFNPRYAWTFDNGFGYQAGGDAMYEWFAVAVRDGDVASSVPEPSSVLLMAVGFGVFQVVFSRRLPNNSAGIAKPTSHDA